MRRLLKASGGSYQFRAYNVRHSYDVSDFLEAYRRLLQKDVDEICGLRSGELKSMIRRGGEGSYQ